MAGGLLRELAFFRSQPRSFQILSLTNMIYGLVTPVIDIFVSAYIMRSSHDPTKVVIYQLTIYTGIPFTFLLNGFLLRCFNVRALFSGGMLLSGVSMLAMMSLRTLDTAGIAAAGLIMGMSFGFYWANRDTLVLEATGDENRNYYYGLDMFSFTLISLLLPVSIGWFIHGRGAEGGAHGAYLVVIGVAFCITILACLVCFRGRFTNPPAERFVYWRFHPLWRRLLQLAYLKGLGQGFLVTAPSMLIMTLLGDEGSLGTAQMIGALFGAVAIYVLGRLTGPSRRVGILTAGVLFFFAGALVNAIRFDAAGVIVFMLLLLLSKSLMDLAYYPMQFRVIEQVMAVERRSAFSYILSHEVGLYAGRLSGALVFLALANGWSVTVALRYAVLLVAAVQLLSVVIGRRLVAEGAALPSPTDEHTLELRGEDATVTQPV